MTLWNRIRRPYEPPAIAESAPSEPLPRPPEHDPAYHALIQRQMAVTGRVQLWERQADAYLRGMRREGGGGDERRVR